MSGPWEVEARREGGRTVCRAYRKRDVKRPDTEENREYYGEASTNRRMVYALAAYLNEREEAYARG